MRHLLLCHGECRSPSIEQTYVACTTTRFCLFRLLFCGFFIKRDIVYIRWVIGCALAIWGWIKFNTVKEGTLCFDLMENINFQSTQQL